MARLEVPVGGRVRKLHALKDQPGYPVKRKTNELGKII
jgi:hypothetical protein